MTHSLQETVVSQTKGDNHYDASKICALFGVSNWRAAIAPLVIDVEKIIESKQNGDNTYILTSLGVKKILTTLSEEKQSDIDPNVLHQFGIHSNGASKKIAAQAAKDKPLEKNTLVGYLRMVFPEQNIETNWVIPASENTVDIFIRSESRKTSIGIICNDARAEPLQLTDDENAQAFKIKAAIAHDIRWLLFKDYKAKRPGPSFFTLIAAIKDILYGPFATFVRKTKPKKTKKVKKSVDTDDEDDQSTKKSKKDKHTKQNKQDKHTKSGKKDKKEKSKK